MHNKRIAPNFISVGMVLGAMALSAPGVDARTLEYYGNDRSMDNKRHLGAWRGRNSIATGNRHGGAHEHKREKARCHRQTAALLNKIAATL